MNKGKFASLIMLGAFVVGVTSSSAVSAQGNKSLAKIVNEDSKSYSDSLDMISKVSDEAISVTNETNVNTEAAINEERKAISKDDSSVAKVDAKNLNGNIEDKTGLLKNLTKVNSKDRDYASVGDIKASEENKAKKIKFAKGAAVFAGSVGAIGSATAIVSGLAKSFITGGSGSETGDTKPTYSPDTESDDASTKLATDSKSSDTKPTYSPDAKSGDTSTGLATDSKSSDTESTYSPDSEYDDTNTEPDTDPKPNNLNQNKKNNKLIKKADIGIGTGIVVIIILLLVYFAICRSLESKSKEIKKYNKNEIVKNNNANNVNNVNKIVKNINENKIVNKKDYNFFKEKLSGLNKSGTNNLKIIVNKLDYSGCNNFENFIIYVKNDNKNGNKQSKIPKIRNDFHYLVECINELDENGSTNFAELIKNVDYKNLSKITSLTNSEYWKYLINILDNENGINNFAKLINFACDYSYGVDLALFIDICGQKDNGVTKLATLISSVESNCINKLGKIISDLDDDDDNNVIVNLATLISGLPYNDLTKLASLISTLDEASFAKLTDRINNLKEEKDCVLFAKNISNLNINNKDDVDNFLKNEELNILNDGSLIQNYE